MRGKLVGVIAAMIVTIAKDAAAQTATPTVTPTRTPTATPTHTSGPSPTPTPPRFAYLYRSDYKLINTVTPNDQQRPAVAVGADGKALFVFHSDAPPANPGFFDIKGIIFNPDGSPATSEFQINQPVLNHIAFTPDVAATANNNFLVVWALFNNTVTDSNIIMRKFGPTGDPLDDAVQVNTFATGKQRLPRIAVNPGDPNEAWIAWESENADGDGYGARARKVNVEDWTFLTPEFQLNNQTAGNQDRVSVAADATGLNVTWLDSVTGVEARRFDPDGNPIANQYNVFPLGFVSPDVGSGESPLYVSTRPDGVFGRVGPGGDLGSIFRIYEPNTGTQVLYGGLCRGEASPGPATYWEQWAAATNEYSAWAQTIEETPAGLQEYFGPFEVLPNANNSWNPKCGRGNDGQFWWGGQNFGGSSDEVYGRWGGQPEAIHPIFGDPAVRLALADVPYETHFRLRNGHTKSESYSGDLTADGGLLTSPHRTTSVVINDSTADYGVVPPGGETDCTTTGDCYNITIQGPRPALDWDEAVTETLNTGVSKTWLIHVGESFPDVPIANPFIEFIETLLHNGITAGGSCGGYCPTDGVKRQQMAVFLLKSRFGRAFTPPPATGTIFTDVPVSNPFASWIEALFLLGITGGCSGGPPPAPTQFCPDAIVNRQQMAVFLLKTFEGSTYVPPAATGIFQDLPAGNVFAPWAEELYARQVTGGCVVSPLQYCPTNPTNRQQMAAFLVKTFGLLLYGP
jgi:hypothetical protein